MSVAYSCTYSVIDSHTAGHPTRVILSGLPTLPGRTVTEKCQYFRAHHDYLRPRLLHEPAGHAAMVGLVPVGSDRADFGAFFISSYIYLDMCGHATIGYAKTLAATGTIASPLPAFTLETPAGIVTVHLQWRHDGRLSSVRLHTIPSYAGIREVPISPQGLPPMTVDLAYSGIWYAMVETGTIDLVLTADNTTDALRCGSAIKTAVTRAVRTLPAELGGGSAPSVLFYQRLGPLRARQMVVLDSNKFDRSPCGTGTAARMALLAAAGEIAEGEAYHAENLLGVAFTARIAGRTRCHDQPAIIPEIEGSAHITAYANIVKEISDPLAEGFLCR